MADNSIRVVLGIGPRLPSPAELESVQEQLDQALGVPSWRWIRLVEPPREAFFRASDCGGKALDGSVGACVPCGGVARGMPRE
jgi:hypothetical protein